VIQPKLIIAGASGGDLMKLSEFPLFDAELHAVEVDAGAGSETWDTSEEVRTLVDATGEFYLLQGDSRVAEVEPPSRTQSLIQLAEHAASSFILLQQKGANFYLQSARAADLLQLQEPIEISIDEMVVDQLNRAGVLSSMSIEEAALWLTNEFLVEEATPWFPIIKEAGNTPSDWTIIGRAWHASLQASPSGALVIKRLFRSSERNIDWIRVAGEVRFVDKTVASILLSESQRNALRLSVESNGSYLDLWQLYGKHEWELTLKNASELGCLKYLLAEPASVEGGVWKFYAEASDIESFYQRWLASESDSSIALEASDAMPSWSESELNLSGKREKSRCRGRPNFRHAKDGYILMDSFGHPPEEGFLFLSLAGDKKVHERRERARQNIQNGVRMPQLHYMLQGLPVPAPRIQKHKALSTYAKACFKHGPPTKRQERAIKVALETPDIALVIGPPGTGKTQVIAALERRLSELGESQTAQHQVLITSFQHDAVENALERTDVYGLPGVKVGSRRQVDSVDSVERWCHHKTEEIDETLQEYVEQAPEFALLEQLSKCKAVLRNSQLTPTELSLELNQFNDLLEALAKLRIRLPAALSIDWGSSLSSRSATNKVLPSRVSSRVSKAVRALRTTFGGFGDDGAERLSDVLALLRGSDLEADNAVVELHRIFESGGEISSENLSSLLNSKNYLLGQLTDYRPPSVRNRLDSEGIELLSKIEMALDDHLSRSRRGIGGILARYRDSFVLDPQRTRNTVENYSMVVGATCQQAASQQMSDLKTLSEFDNSGISFNSVIIDEAARANPLDLFIPMSMANRRVVLVGDHRQLPHLLQPKIEKEVASMHKLSDEQRTAYEESLFQRLWRQLKEREASDGICRVVMLDEQFRMNPVLGRFVSSEFYEAEGLDEVKSPRPESDFLSDIPGYRGKVCAWINVPYGADAASESRKDTTSWFRIDEARRVADEAIRLLTSADNDDVSLGIITFYSAQRDRIFQAMESKGAVIRDDETGEWRIAEHFRKNSHGDERLRIGTVDAFQGKEFDVVILSAVRSNKKPLPPSTEAGNFETAANHKYGHLRLSNRMNVAMSRQRSLLIVIGDKEMANEKGADAAVPALRAYLELCQGEHGCVF
jgi:DNA polymerase III delta prime subunit